MPSTHTAFSLSVVILVALYESVFSSMFAVAMVFTILIIRDALGLRRYLEEHSRAINQIINTLPNNQNGGFINQTEQIGHTLREVLGGGMLGILLTLLLYFILP
ncbi:MAG: divergent PAP2 family protein, partial [bacterium]|nr:divergent PAP2 family protein [bacterium]